MQEKVGKHVENLNWGYTVQFIEKDIEVFLMKGSLLDKHTI